MKNKLLFIFLFFLFSCYQTKEIQVQREPFELVDIQMKIYPQNDAKLIWILTWKSRRGVEVTEMLNYPTEDTIGTIVYGFLR